MSDGLPKLEWYGPRDLHGRNLEGVCMRPGNLSRVKTELLSDRCSKTLTNNKNREIQDNVGIVKARRKNAITVLTARISVKRIHS